MNITPLLSLKPESIATIDYYGRNGELLIPKGVLITSRLLEMLENRNNFDLFTVPEGGGSETFPATHAKRPSEPSEPPFMTESERLFLSLTEPEPKELTFDIFNLKPGSQGLLQLGKSAIARMLDIHLLQHSVIDRPVGPPLRNKASQLSVNDRTEVYKNEISGLYANALNETKNLLRLLARNTIADAKSLEDIVRQFIRIFISDRNILLNISTIKSRSDDHIFHHSLNVCLLAINIAAAYGYSERQVLEIGMGAIVHDIGMLLIPYDLRMKPSRLTEEELCEIRKHPILGLHLLQKLKNMPERIPYITYQVHERENSTGYPRMHRSGLIHRFAKVVQVADIYEALTSARPHRPSFLPSEAVHKIVQMSQKNLIPADAVRAFVGYLSLFPIGSLVELNDHRIGKVIQSNENALNRPIVSVLINEQGAMLPYRSIYQIDLSQNPQISIIKTLPLGLYESVDIMDGF